MQSIPRRGSVSRRPGQRRSPCPVSCTLDLIGDRWSLLVVRDLVLGRQRFKEFVASPEGIPTNILAERLERLRQGGVVAAVATRAGSSRVTYRLTPKGEALRPVLQAMLKWGLKWEKGTRLLVTGAGAAPARPPRGNFRDSVG